jgi:hypothetical protein
MADIKHRMAERHETDVAALFKPLGGYKSKGSGATERDKNDGRTDHFGRWPFSWDCKATQGQSISVSRAMLAKLAQDAGGDRPVLPLRIYLNDQLDIAPGGDLVAFTYTDAGEIIEALVELEQLKARIAEAVIVNIPDHLTDDQVAEFEQQITAALAGGQPLTRASEGISALPDETFSAMSAALIAAQDRQAELESQATEHRERADDLARKLSEADTKMVRATRQLREASAELVRRRADDLERSQAAQMRQEQAEASEIAQHDPGELERLQGSLSDAERHLIESHLENDRIMGLLVEVTSELENLQAAPLSPQPDAPAQTPVDIPQLPWMVVHQVKLPGDKVALTGVWWDQNGRSHPTAVHDIRLEPDSPTTERLIVNDRRVREGDLYIGGARRLRVGAP